MQINSMLFEGLLEYEIENFLKDSKSTIADFREGEYIFLQEDEPKFVFILLEGSVVVENIDYDGQKNIVNIFSRKGTVFGEVYVYIDKKKYDYSCYTNENTKILIIPKESLYLEDELDKTKNKIINNMIRILANKSYFLNQKSLLLGSIRLRKKLIKFLLNITEENRVELKFTREELGRYLGVSRPSVSRELMNMKKDKIISIDKNIIRFDREKLESLI